MCDILTLEPRVAPGLSILDRALTELMTTNRDPEAILKDVYEAGQKSVLEDPQGRA